MLLMISWNSSILFSHKLKNKHSSRLCNYCFFFKYLNARHLYHYTKLSFTPNLKYWPKWFTVVPKIFYSHFSHSWITLFLIYGTSFLSIEYSYLLVAILSLLSFIYIFWVNLLTCLSSTVFEIWHTHAKLISQPPIV